MQPVHLINKYSGLTVLIVDDFPAMLKTVGSMLISIGFKKVIKAAHGKEALQILEEEKVDLIISDWNMPKLNGLGLLKAIRQGQSEHRNVPFMMLTANVNHNDVRQAIELGVTEYLIKPFNQSTLKDKISSAFNSPVRQVAVKTVNDKPAEKIKDIKADLSTLLIVDDNANNVAILTELLKSQYKLKACLSGQKALDICQQEVKPDLILLDIMMPDMDGLEVCKQLKSDPLTEHIPIIFISALSQDKDVIKGLNLGAVDYITKPISPEITKARVATHIRLVEQRKDVSKQLDTLLENARLKDEIERIMHHDLKGPLSTIVAATEIIGSKNVGCNEEVEILQSSASSIQKMVDDHMLIYKLENNSAQCDSEAINAFKLINEVLFGLKPKSLSHQVFVSTKIAADVHFIGDKVLSLNLFHNLLANAIEAAPEKSKIHLSQLTDENWLTINIHNDGEIPARIQQRFFDKFVTSGKSNGTGIGTYSAMLSAKAQGGDVAFTSDLQSGTTLSVRLKRSK
ncbi:ATP-binding response regulator [Shewanella goraebulensis]|uniref:ATP-binding response regulator n=1 Tax=Shewanella goraebulensis TaxID=3050637 RepID=UPI00254F46A8|nr:response regulator [Shewanella goraebulensis]